MIYFTMAPDKTWIFHVSYSRAKVKNMYQQNTRFSFPNIYFLIICTVITFVYTGTELYF